MFGKRTPESSAPKATRADLKLVSPYEKEMFKELENLAPLLLASLHHEIQQGHIGTIIGIDGSGRMPSILMSNAIKLMQKKRGFEGPKLHFLNGKIAEKAGALEQLPDAIRRKNIETGRKVLVVDDTYNTGASVSAIITELEAQGYDVELVVFSSINPTEMRAAHPKSHYAGIIRSIKVRKKSTIAGVRSQGDIAGVHAEVLRPRSDDPKMLELVPVARRVLDDMATRVVAKYEKMLEEEEG